MSANYCVTLDEMKKENLPEKKFFFVGLVLTNL